MTSGCAAACHGGLDIWRRGLLGVGGGGFAEVQDGVSSVDIFDVAILQGCR